MVQFHRTVLLDVVWVGQSVKGKKKARTYLPAPSPHLPKNAGVNSPVFSACTLWALSMVSRQLNFRAGAKSVLCRYEGRCWQIVPMWCC